MMNQATRHAAMVPAITSTFCENRSFTDTPFSTTLLWLKNIIHGAMVVPIIAMTANAFSEDVERSRKAGMTEHLSKPLNAETLKKAILRNI